MVLQALSSWSFPVASSSALVSVGLRGRLVSSQLITRDLCAPLKARLRRRNQLGGGHDQAEVPGIGAGGPVSSRKRKLAAMAARILIPLLKQERVACAPNRPRMGITFESLLKPFTDGPGLQGPLSADEAAVRPPARQDHGQVPRVCWQS